MLDEPERDSLRKLAFVQARSWAEDEGSSKYLNTAGDRVVSSVPVIVDLSSSRILERDTSYIQSDYDARARSHQPFLRSNIDSRSSSCYPLS